MLVVRVVVEVWAALTSESFSDADGALVAWIDQQGRHAVVRVRGEMIEEQTNGASRVSATAMGEEDVVADVHFTGQQPRSAV